MASFSMGLGAILCILGIALITMRPAANPLVGRVLIGLGVLVLAVVFWHVLGQPGFQADR